MTTPKTLRGYTDQGTALMWGFFVLKKYTRTRGALLANPESQKIGRPRFARFLLHWLEDN
jgi:hypothetical protein